MCIFPPISRPTCTNVPMCTSVDRPGRPAERAELSVCSGRPTESVYSLFRFLGRPSGQPLSQRSKIQLLAVDRPGRPPADKVCRLAANGYILFCLLLGLLPTNLLVFLTQFSSPINSESVIQLKHKIIRVKSKFLKV